MGTYIVAGVECRGREGKRAEEDEGTGDLGRKRSAQGPPHPVTSTTFISAFPRRDSVKDTGVQACLAPAMG